MLSQEAPPLGPFGNAIQSVPSQYCRTLAAPL
jgi:hypothetical protein